MLCYCQEADWKQQRKTYDNRSKERKCGVTEISVSPELWFQMRLTDYAANKDKFKEANNRLIDEMGLRAEFKIR